MSVQTITYTDKQQLNANSSVADYNKVNAADMNEIKTVVNNNATELTNAQSQVVYRDWSQSFTCPQGMTTGTVTVPTVTGYTCIANVLRDTSSAVMMYELSANGKVKIYNHSTGSLTFTMYGRFIYVKS